MASLEADGSFYRRFDKLPEEAKDVLERLLRQLEGDSPCLPDIRGEVDGEPVFCQPLGSGWVCGCVPIYPDIYPESGVPPLTVPPSKILLCLYESEEIFPDYLPAISS